MQTKLSDGSVMICGILPRDAEYKQVGEKNSSLTKFSIKVGEKKVLGQEKTQAIWVNVQCWHSIARAVQNLKKLDTALVIGKIEKKPYTAKDGTQKEDIHVNAEYVNCMPNIQAPVYPQTDQANNNLESLDGFEDVYSVLDDTDNLPF